MASANRPSGGIHVNHNDSFIGVYRRLKLGSIWSNTFDCMLRYRKYLNSKLVPVDVEIVLTPLAHNEVKDQTVQFLIMISISSDERDK